MYGIRIDQIDWLHEQSTSRIDLVLCNKTSWNVFSYKSKWMSPPTSGYWVLLPDENWCDSQYIRWKLYSFFLFLCSGSRNYCGLILGHKVNILYHIDSRFRTQLKLYSAPASCRVTTQNAFALNSELSFYNIYET